MSRQSKNASSVAGIEPSLAHAAALVQEYTGKLRAIIRRVHAVREEYLAAMQKWLKQPSPSPNLEVNHAQQEQHLCVEVVNDFRSRHDEYTAYLRALIPQARRLAQHVSQLITHGTDQTLVQIELGLRVAELESAIEAARDLANSKMVFSGS